MEKLEVWLVYRQYYEGEDPLLLSVAGNVKEARALLDKDEIDYPLCYDRWYENWTVRGDIDV